MKDSTDEAYHQESWITHGFKEFINAFEWATVVDTLVRALATINLMRSPVTSEDTRQAQFVHRNNVHALIVTHRG